MTEIEKYLCDNFGAETKLYPIKNSDKSKLPVYMRNYDLKIVEINNQRIIVIKPENPTEFTTERFRQLADIVENLLDWPVVFVLRNLEAYKRKRLIEKKIGFVVPGKQLYIPHLFIELREIKNQQQKKKEKFSPAAQCLLLYYLLDNKVTGLNFKTLAEKLNYGQMTITRAAYTLAHYYLCKIEGGKNKSLVIDGDNKQIWNGALPFLSSPIKKEIYLDDIKYNNDFYITGINALAHYTNIAGDNSNSFAIYDVKIKNLLHKQKKGDTDRREGNYLIQVWKYNPGQLTDNRFVDPLSLYLSLMDDEDERIKKELNILIEELW